MNIEQFKKFKKKKEFVAFILYYSNQGIGYERPLRCIFSVDGDLFYASRRAYNNVHSTNRSDARVRDFIMSKGKEVSLLEDISS